MGSIAPGEVFSRCQRIFIEVHTIRILIAAANPGKLLWCANAPLVEAVLQDLVAAAHVDLAGSDGRQRKLDDAAGAGGRAPADQRVVAAEQQLERHGVPCEQAALLVDLRARTAPKDYSLPMSKHSEQALAFLTFHTLQHATCMQVSARNTLLSRVLMPLNVRLSVTCAEAVQDTAA